MGPGRSLRDRKPAADFDECQPLTEQVKDLQFAWRQRPAAVAGGQEPEVMDGLSAPLTLPVVPEGADATGNGGEEDLLVEPAAVPFAGEITDQELQWRIDAAV